MRVLETKAQTRAGLPAGRITLRGARMLAAVGQNAKRAVRLNSNELPSSENSDEINL